MGRRAEAGFAGARELALFAALGLLLVAATAATIATTRTLDHTRVPEFRALLPLILGLACPAALLLAAGRWIVRLQPSVSAIAIMVAVGLAMRLVWMGNAPPLDDDYYRYLLDGAMVAHGQDPYRHPPAAFSKAPVAAGLPQFADAKAERVVSQINFPEMRSIYPSVAQAAFAAAHLIAPFELDGLRVVFLAGEMATLVLLLALLRVAGAPRMWAALYWWNPLASAMAVGFAHVDALVPPLVLGALLAVFHDRRSLAVALLGLGAGVKIWPLLLVPIVLWPLLGQPRRLIAACSVLGIVLLLAVGPVVWSAMRPGSGLSAYAGAWSNNNAFYSWLVYGMRAGLGLGDGAEQGLRLMLGATAAAIALYLAAFGQRTPMGLIRQFMAVAAAVFYLSPAQFPWYALWFLALAAAGGCWPLLLASALLPFYYLYWLHWPLEGGPLIFYSIAFIHSVPVLGMLLWSGRQRAVAKADQTV